MSLNNSASGSGYLGKVDPLLYLNFDNTIASSTIETLVSGVEASSGVGEPTPTPEVSPTPSPTPPTPSPVNEPITQNSLTVLDNELGFLRVRSEPSTSSEELGQVNPGQVFEVVGEQDGWYKIEYTSGQFGWISGNYVTIN